MRSRSISLLALSGALLFAACDSETSPVAPDGEDVVSVAAAAANVRAAPGVVFTSTNQEDGNDVLAFARSADGSLTATGSYATGGLGTGGGLGNQGAVTLTRDGRTLLVVNAGSDDVSVFRVGGGLDLLSTTDSRGTRPISATIHKDVVYVLNGGGTENVAGFRLDRSGALEPIAGAVYPLSAANVGSAQVDFSPDGRTLVVTEKATNRIVTFPVRRGGMLGSPTVTSSASATPFGFAFNRQGALVVSEAVGGQAGASVASSYSVGRDGDLDVVSPSVATTQTAACWIVIGQNGRFAYASNTGSGSISLYSLTPGGDLALIDGVAAQSDGSRPIDMAISQGGRFFYVLNGGTGEIGAYAIGSDGGLSHIEGAAGLPAGTTGLVAR